MHISALLNAKLFFETYKQSILNGVELPIVIDIGALNINGSIKDVCPSEFKYIGVDCVSGNGVDIILSDPYLLPFSDNYADIVTASSCFEHSEMFWLLFLEILRILKPKGLFYLNVPSNGIVHRYPVDCWRFYPDSGLALTKWAKRNGYNTILLESFISRQAVSYQIADQWNDFVAVFLKDEKFVCEFKNFMVDVKKDFDNGIKYGFENLLKPSELNEDQKKFYLFLQVINNNVRVV